MYVLIVQIHFERAPDLDLARLRNVCGRVAEVKGARYDEQTDEMARYRDMVFAAEDRAGLWRALRPVLFDDHFHGPQLKDAAIVICQGEDGWDDYLLLHHFDPAEVIDPLA